jgi:excisionase family DNA binding protein
MAKKGWKMTTQVEQINARLHPVEVVMERLGVGRSTVFDLLASRQIRSVKIGRRRLVSEAALGEFIDGLGA